MKNTSHPIAPTQLSISLLDAARDCWNSAADIRARRQRALRFTYGDQWADIADIGDGRLRSLRQIALDKGQTPLSTNLIRRLVRCIIGRFRLALDEAPKPQAPLDRLAVDNNLDELDSRSLEEFIISGCVAHRVVTERRPAGLSTWVDPVSPDRLIINPTADPRGWDTELIGMIHDISLTEAIMRFSHGDKRRADQIRHIFTSQPDPLSFSSRQFLPSPAGRCRVFEIWTLEAAPTLICHDRETARLFSIHESQLPKIEAENARRAAANRSPISHRWQPATRWTCRWLAPDASILDSRSAQSHPFAVKLYPLIDGQVHSIVEDLLDQQIYINRLITLVDHLLSSSAKGVLLFPISQKLPETKWDDIARHWARPDGMIPIAGVPGAPEPKQICGTGNDAGAKELLQLQMKMFEDVSGVSNALMGRSSANGNVGIQRYEAEVKNATISILDLLRSFDDFRQTRNRLILKAYTPSQK